MNHVERFRAVMNFKSVDRLPRIEWAMWWDKTIERWHNEGLPRKYKFSDVFDILQYLGLDPYIQFWFSTTSPDIDATQHHTEGVVGNMDDYLAIRPHLYPDHSKSIDTMISWGQKQKNGDVVVWATLEGFFWFPRTLMDISRLSYAYYDQPELIHRMNSDLLEFNLSLLKQMKAKCVPTFITIAEDMSYNHGPMISEQIFAEFIEPYYKILFAELDELNIIRIIDTDGDVTIMVPWLRRAGAHGILPLERQAGVDGNKLREAFPDCCMIGHYDKMIMKNGIDAMRREFERLLPIMKTGGFIPSVDHQTPPDVSLQNYREYIKLLYEYTELAAK
jgi:hypothetical protein